MRRDGTKAVPPAIRPPPPFAIFIVNMAFPGRDLRCSGPESHLSGLNFAFPELKSQFTAGKLQSPEPLLPFSEPEMRFQDRKCHYRQRYCDYPE
jgi:hypothetical protein